MIRSASAEVASPNRWAKALNFRVDASQAERTELTGSVLATGTFLSYFPKVNETAPKGNLSGISRWLSAPVLTRGRIWFAFTVAVLTDAIQLGLGPLGWVLVDEFLDVLAMVLTSAALGFHMLLLPTFVLELIPGPDMLPTWTGCTAAVVMLRKRAQRQTAPPPIDVYAEVSAAPPRETPGGKG